MGLRGLEPPWVTPTDPKSVASASFATGPYSDLSPLKENGESKVRFEKPEGEKRKGKRYELIVIGII